jgi:hypothetical protein
MLNLTSREYAEVRPIMGAVLNAIPVQGWTGPEGARRFRLPEFLDNRHTTVARLSARRTGFLYPQKILLILVSVRGCVDPKSIARPEELSRTKCQ